MKSREDIDEAKEELKRADHLIFVTLKYTRTIDVIRNTIKRLINAFDFEILKALESAKNKKRIKLIPLLPRPRYEFLVKLMKDERIAELIDFYSFLRRTDRIEGFGKDEYRKNVAMVVLDSGKRVEIDMKTLRDYFDKTKYFIELVDEWINRLR